MHKWYEAPGEENDVVFASRVRLARNLADLPFPARMSASDRARVCTRVQNALAHAPEMAFQAVELETLDEVAAVSLVERQLCTAAFIAEPAGRMLFYTREENASVMVNGTDHVQLLMVSSGACLPDVLAQADNLDTVMDRTLRYAFHTKLGYLTQQIEHLGTGMLPSLELSLPALQQGGATERLFSDMAQMGYSLRGLFDSVTEPSSALYELTNRVTLGISESDAVKNLCTIAGQLIARERQARTALLQTAEAQDALSRALAVLSSARSLEFSEFLRLYARVRMGVCAGLVGGIRVEQLDTLLFTVQPATLLLRAGKPLSEAQQQERRAQFVSGALTPAFLAL